MIQTLESRRMFSITVDAEGILTVRGTTSAEFLHAEWRTFANGDMTVKVSDGSITQNHNHRVSDPSKNYFNRVALYGGNGADTLRTGYLSGWGNSAVALLPITAWGEAANDTLHGSEGGNETLSGGSSNDWLYGYGGDDVLDSHYGADTVVGGTGTDSISGQWDAEIDVLWGDDFGNTGTSNRFPDRYYTDRKILADGSIVPYDTLMGFDPAGGDACYYSANDHY